MKNIKKAGSIKCYKREVTYLVDDVVYFGTIQYIGNFGASISVRKPFNIPKGKKICVNMLSQNQIEEKQAEVAWTDESSFGAKFV
jgi:hypothetical protein